MCMFGEIEVAGLRFELTSPGCPEQTEKQLQNQVVTLAQYCGWLHYHTLDSRGSTAGFPDLVLLRPPRLLFVELKSEKGRLRPEQKVWAAALEIIAKLPGSPVEYHLWRPSDLDEISRILDKTA